MMATEWVIPQNATDFGTLFNGINSTFSDTGNGYFLSYAILIVVWAVLFIASKDYTKEYAAVYATFITFIISVLIWAMGSLQFYVVGGLLIGTGVCLLFAHFQSSGGV